MRKLFSLLRVFAIHWLPNLVLVAGLVAAIKVGLPALAIGLVLVSKWQVLRGGSKIWLHNLRAQACDLVVALSSLTLLILTRDDFLLQILTATIYYIWLVIVKPRGGPIWVGVQAALCQFVGLSVIFLLGRAMPQMAVVALSWLVALVAVDHFLAAHEEPANLIVSFLWALMVAQLSWLFWRWLIIYSLLSQRILVPQAPLVITILGYTFGNIYLDHARRRLGKVRLAEYILLCFGLFVAIIFGTQWSTRI